MQRACALAERLPVPHGLQHDSTHGQALSGIHSARGQPDMSLWGGEHAQLCLKRERSAHAPRRHA